MFLFTKKAVGIDIADQTIEIVQLAKKGKKTEVLSLARQVLEPGIVSRGRIQDKEKLRDVLKKTLAEAKPAGIFEKRVVFGLPETQVFIFDFELGSHNKKDRDLLILAKAQRNIPLEKDDLLLSYRVLAEKDDGAEILLAAASRETVEEWDDFFRYSGLSVAMFDVESLAIFRALFSEPPVHPVLIADIGENVTNLAVFDSQGLRYSHSLNIGGATLTEEISSCLKINSEQAEQKKLAADLADEKSLLCLPLIKALEGLVQELKKLIDYFQTRNGEKIQEVILAGGSSKLKGIAAYFTANLEVPVKLGVSSFLAKEAPLEYLEAVGLALRGLEEKRFQNQPLISLEEKIVERKSKIFSGRSAVKIVLDGKRKARFRTDGQGIRSKKILLAVIIIVGLFSVGLGSWYQNYRKNQKILEQKARASQFTQTQSFDLKIPLAVDAAEQTPDRVKGKIIENVINAAGDYNEAVAFSRTAASKQLKKGEKLWLEPLNKLSEPQEAVFPITIKWLAFNEKEAADLFLEEIEKINSGKTEFIFNKIEKLSLEPTENPDIFYLSGQITISLNQLIVQESGAGANGATSSQSTSSLSTSSLPAVSDRATSSQPQAVIQETETGWLNVRTGPGTNFSVVAKVFPGESYPLLEELTNWYKIEIGEGKEGWISAKYAKKQ